MVTSSDGVTRRRWTDAVIESELRAQTAELGHFPTRSELVARGLRGLWDAMRTSGGVDAWQARVNGNFSAPSREEIAARAYALYADGSPGDAEAHWFAAEQELISQPTG
jgi:Protein of unknown function (DUF2934)